MFRTIIVPLNGSAHAEAALVVGINEARRHGARLVLVRVVVLPEPPVHLAARGGAPMVLPEYPQTQTEAARFEAENYLVNLADRFDVPPGTERRVLVGEPVQRLLAELKRHPDPLLVATAGDSSNGQHPPLSEVARRITVAGTAPVLIVRGDGAAVPTCQDHDILVS